MCKRQPRARAAFGEIPRTTRQLSDKIPVVCQVGVSDMCAEAHCRRLHSTMALDKWATHGLIAAGCCSIGMYIGWMLGTRRVAEGCAAETADSMAAPRTDKACTAGCCGPAGGSSGCGLTGTDPRSGLHLAGTSFVRGGNGDPLLTPRLQKLPALELRQLTQGGGHAFTSADRQLINHCYRIRSVSVVLCTMCMTVCTPPPPMTLLCLVLLCCAWAQRSHAQTCTLAISGCCHRHCHIAWNRRREPVPASVDARGWNKS